MGERLGRVVLLRLGLFFVLATLPILVYLIRNELPGTCLLPLRLIFIP